MEDITVSDSYAVYYDAEDSNYDPWIRFLQSNSTGNNATTTTTQSDTKVLRYTFFVYGIAFLVLITLFCVSRRWFPKAYNLRSWVEGIRSPLADDMFGLVSWMWRVLMVSDDALLEHCTLDFLCFDRILKMGLRISLMAVFNAFWLMPLYATAPVTRETANVTDALGRISIAHVPPGAKQLIGPSLACYTFFGYFMYAVFNELVWYIDRRHQFMAQPEAHNYTVYIRNIPPEFRSNWRLIGFFRNVYSSSAVIDVQFLMRVPALSKLVARRDVVNAKLERAIMLREKTGREPTHLQPSLTLVDSERVNSIDTYAQELVDLNREIKERIQNIRRDQADPGPEEATEVSTDMAATEEFMKYPQSHSTLVHLEEVSTERDHLLDCSNENVHARCRTLMKGSLPTDETSDASHLSMRRTLSSEQSLPPEQPRDERTDNKSNLVANTAKIAAKAGVITASLVTNTATQAISTVTTTATSAAAQAVALLQAQEGQFNDAAFVMFSRLSTVHSALQMLQHNRPFTMEIMEAPESEDVFWLNIGRSHKDLEIGWLLSMTATFILCLFWTVPIAFVASLNSVAALTAFLPFVGQIVEAVPILKAILPLLAPLLVVLLNSLLPSILGLFTMLEGPISSATLLASKFTKLAIFNIVQTFFISAITKGAVSVASQIAGQVQEILANPLLFVDLLATELAQNSYYFMQIIFVSTVTSSGFELLRVFPLLFALVRRCCGPRLTPRERKQPCLGLFRPLSDVSWFDQADVLASIILLFMVLFVYAAISPIVSFVAVFCFGWLRVTYRNQNIFVYPPRPDSGGKLWPKAIRILLSCMLIAEIVTLGILGLRQSLIAIPLMVPLIVISSMFFGYINKQHFRVAENLTADACMLSEVKLTGTVDVHALVRDKYVQPAMQHETVLPELPDGVPLPDCLRDLEDGQLDNPACTTEHRASVPET